MNANIPLAQVRSLGDLYDRSMERTSFTLVMLGIAVMMALLLGVVGLYGVISYAVSQRRHEIGIRMALGAQRREILGLFVRRGLIVTIAGLALGLGAAAGFSQVMRALLFGVSPLDPVAFVAVPALLGTTALTAIYLPARRAVSVNPVETIRVESRVASESAGVSQASGAHCRSVASQFITTVIGAEFSSSALRLTRTR